MKLSEEIKAGGAAKYHEANAAKGKLFARERIARLVDEGSFVEDGLFANALADGLPADGVVTGTATVDGRPVALMANDSTVKAGSWGARTVEKIIRIIERAYSTGVPMVYLVDSAGARITDQVDLFPGRRGRREDLPHPGAGVRVDPAGVRAVRAVGRRRRLHPGVLRPRGHGRRQRLDVPGQRPDGRDGDRREDHAGGDGRRPRCTAPSPAVGHLLVDTDDGRDRRGPRATCRTCRDNWQRAAARRRSRRAGQRRPARRWCPAVRAAGLRHAPLRPRRCVDDGSLLRDPRAVGRAR